MSKSRDSQAKMLHELAAFKKKRGHCNVPTAYRGNPQLGRWVAAQRYKRKVDDLSEASIRKLDRLGFVWSPSDQAWDKMFQLLVDFKRTYGHCNVPTHWRGNQSLANWLQRQRYREKKKKLPSERMKRLEKLGFSWSIYKSPKERTIPIKEGPSTKDSESLEERLYSIRNGIYVQYGAKGRKPEELKKYMADHNGEFPPYIPLPKGRTNFYLGERYLREKKIYWKGNGDLPEEVLDYVRENGRLPPYDW